MVDGTSLAKRLMQTSAWGYTVPFQLPIGLYPPRMFQPTRDGYGVLWRYDETEWLPDLNDPATIGCLLARVRKVFPGASTYRGGGQWCCEMEGCALMSSRAWYGATEAEALVAALEAAP